MNKAIFIHGWGGFPAEGWRPWLKAELESRGWEVVNPAMPNTDNPTQDEWVTELNKVISNPDENTFLIGHSLGGISILRYLETLPEGVKIGGAVLVAGFANNLSFEGYKNELASFFKTEVKWPIVTSHCDNFFILHSEDDNLVPVDNYYDLRERLDADGELVEGFRHFSGSDGITELPIVLDKLIEMSAKTKN